MPTLSTIGAACARAWGFTSGLVKDQYFNLVSLLLPGNGTDGKQNRTFLDSSGQNGGAGWTITPNGNATQGTFSPFSQTGWGNYFNGSSNYRLTIPDSTDLDIAGDFCLELWVYFLSQSASNQLVCIGSESAAQNGFILYNASSTPSEIALYTNGSTAITTSSAGITTNRWHHIALVRSGTGAGNTVIYVDGVSRGSAQITTSFTGLAANGLSIGQTYNGSYVGVLNAYLSNVRLVNGSPVYTGAFTPPTTPLTAITNTKLLTCQSNRFVDTNTQVAAKTITVTGSPSVTPFSPFAPTQPYSAAAVGGSGYFDGTGDYLTGPTNTATAFNLTGDFTIEAWIYCTDIAASPSGGQGILSWADSSGWNGWQVFHVNGSLKFEFLTGSTGAGAITSSTITNSQWVHIAVVRSGTSTDNIKFYVNGVSGGSVSYNSSQTSSSSFIKVGADRTGGNLLRGYISNARVVNGTAVYTGSFTPPTAPLTAITNTSLLLNFTNAGVVDATAKNVLETVGNAQISTTQSKWGGGSIYFDGTGSPADYLSFPDTPTIRLGSSDFVFECWARFDDFSSTRHLCFLNGNTSAYAGLRLGVGTDSKIFLLMSQNGSTFAVSSGAIGSALSTNTWYYIAVQRSSAGVKVFVDGSQIGITYSLSGAVMSGTVNYIGEITSVSQPMKGYMDDVRLTLYARTITASPTAPFPVQ